MLLLSNLINQIALIKQSNIAIHMENSLISISGKTILVEMAQTHATRSSDMKKKKGRKTRHNEIGDVGGCDENSPSTSENAFPAEISGDGKRRENELSLVDGASVCVGEGQRRRKRCCERFYEGFESARAWAWVARASDVGLKLSTKATNPRE